MRKNSRPFREINSLAPSGERAKGEGQFRDRRGEVLFIDARKLGKLVDRTHRELTADEIARIANTYHAWRLPAPPACAGQADRQSNAARQAGGPDIAARGRDRGGQAVAG